MPRPWGVCSSTTKAVEILVFVGYALWIAVEETLGGGSHN
jgi:hypothetical protein